MEEVRGGAFDILDLVEGGAGFHPLEVSEEVGLDPLVGSEGAPYPLKSFERVVHPASFPEGYMN